MLSFVLGMDEREKGREGGEGSGISMRVNIVFFCVLLLSCTIITSGLDFWVDEDEGCENLLSPRKETRNFNRYP